MQDIPYASVLLFFKEPLRIIEKKKCVLKMLHLENAEAMKGRVADCMEAYSNVSM